MRGTVSYRLLFSVIVLSAIYFVSFCKIDANWIKNVSHQMANVSDLFFESLDQVFPVDQINNPDPVDQIVSEQTIPEVIVPDLDQTSTTTDQTSTTTDQTSTTTDQTSTTTNETILSPVEEILKEFIVPKVDDSPLAIKSVSSPIIKGTFRSGVVPIIVTFNRSVIVSGTPRLILLTGNPQTTAVDLRFVAGNRLYFLYRIVPGNSVSFLDYASSAALDLNSGSIRDAGGNEANLTLPDPGSAGSLEGNSKIIIKTSSADGV